MIRAGVIETGLHEDEVQARDQPEQDERHVGDTESACGARAGGRCGSAGHGRQTERVMPPSTRMFCPVM
jgi:hypothetical protein